MHPFRPTDDSVVEHVYQSLLGVVGFIATNPVRPINNPGNHWISQWYRENSLVYVSPTHSLWKKEGRASKRYGKLIKSQSSVLNQMMKLHEPEVHEWMTDRAGLEDAADETYNGGVSGVSNDGAEVTVMGPSIGSTVVASGLADVVMSTEK